MLNRKHIFLIVVILAIIIFMLVYRLTSDRVTDPEGERITRAQVAQCVSMLYHDLEDIENIKEDFFNGSSDKWYVPYMDKMYEDTYFLQKDVKPTDSGAMTYFTYGDLEDLFINMGIVDEEIWSYVHNNNSMEKIQQRTWSQIYLKLIELIDTQGEIDIKEINIAGDQSISQTINQDEVVTSIGILKCQGIDPVYYIDKNVTIILRDNKILWITKINSEEITYYNTFIISIENGTLKCFVQGIVREFNIKDKMELYSSVIGDIKIKNGSLTDYNIKNTSLTGKVLKSSEKGIEIEGSGFYELDKNCQIYKTYGNIQMKSVKDIVVGYDVSKFIVEDGKINSIIIDRDMNWEDIRVLIKTSDYKDIYHDEVVISSDTSFEISYGDKLEVIEGGSKLSFDESSPYLESGRITISTQDINGKINIESIKRSYGIPSYRGTIEIAKIDNKLVVINELPVEQYLMSVVPSEMPYTYNMEALKAQAVCARSYAYTQIKNNYYSELGAHVDDSTAFQVYNNVEEKAPGTNAVTETYGQVIKYNEEVVAAYFFSTSCGSTSDGKVWSENSPVYLKNKILTSDNTEIDLSDEKNFDPFIRNNYTTFDSEYPWYRWTLKMTLEDITKTVNDRIGILSDDNSENVFELEEDKFVNKQVYKIGNIKKIETGSRGAGGVLQYIIIYGTEKTIKVTSEYCIRKLFYPISQPYIRNDGSKNTNFLMLPSGYFLVDPIAEDGTLTGYNFVGGGYGHGVGMSQNGANTMANQGNAYDEILKFFYKDIIIEKIY